MHRTQSRPFVRRCRLSLWKTPSANVLTNVCWVPVADYLTLARWTKDEFMPGLRANSLGRRIVMLANWNEFGEGHFLMPSSLAGFGYLDALRDPAVGVSLEPDDPDLQGAELQAFPALPIPMDSPNELQENGQSPRPSSKGSRHARQPELPGAHREPGSL